MLKYIGNGSFIPGIPARDMQDDEAAGVSQDYIFGHGDKQVRGVDALIASGLYQKADGEHREGKAAGSQNKSKKIDGGE